MITCNDCGAQSPRGTLICTCGSVLVAVSDVSDQEPVQTSQEPQRLPIAIVRGQLIPPSVPSLAFHVIHVDGKNLNEGDYWGSVPVSQLQVPHRLGRRDTRRVPALRPEFDLHELLQQFGQPRRKPVSRIHATIELVEGAPSLRHQVEGQTTTWVRSSGSRRFRAAPYNRPFPLAHRDVVLLGKPKGHHVKLRVELM